MSLTCYKCGVPLVVGENVTQGMLNHRQRNCRTCRNTYSKAYQRKTRDVKKRLPKTQYIYVIVHPRITEIKVGITSGVLKKRLSDYNICCPNKAYSYAFTAEVTNYREVERTVHKILAPHKHSHEWFACSIEQAIEAIQAASQRPAVTTAF